MVESTQTKTIASKVTADAPVIIIGAGRSGTNMLRDLICGHAGFATWPCDEINYIWRHGHRGFATDAFTREMADDKTKRYIQRQFQRFACSASGARVVEKTCANALRCGFIHEIFPQASFIHLIRDGRDVAASAAHRWNAPLDIPYLLRKARFVPRTDLPYYASRYLSARLFRAFSGKNRLSTWGPRFDGMDEILSSQPLINACALQWQACVNAAADQLGELPAQQVLTVRYEDFVEQPAKQMQQIFGFLKADTNSLDLKTLTCEVSNTSKGKWKQQLTAEQQQSVESQVGATLRRFGYLSGPQE